jgi:hypothetical protein
MDAGHQTNTTFGQQRVLGTDPKEKSNSLLCRCPETLVIGPLANYTDRASKRTNTRVFGPLANYTDRATKQTDRQTMQQPQD